MRTVAEHLEELRRRVLIAASFFVIFFIAGVALSSSIIRGIADDLIVSKARLVSLSPIEFLYTQIIVGLVVAAVLSSPVVIYHLIRFVRPGLKKHEAAALRLILPSFILLFAAGAVFAYTVFIRVSLWMLAGLSSSAGVENLWGIGSFISFILVLGFAFGLVFQLPLLMLLLKRLGLISREGVRQYRPHIYTASFIAAAVLTPPDAVTQLMLAVPVVALFELSILFIL